MSEFRVVMRTFGKMTIIMKRLVFAALAVVVSGALMADPVRSLTPVPQSNDPNHWWVKRFNEKQELVKKGGSEVVFIGDSITHFLEAAVRPYFDQAKK